MYDTLANLIKESYTANAIGEQTSTEVAKTIWAEKKSVQRSEWVAAGQQGLNPTMLLVTPSENYSGEEIAEVEGKRYAIYRTYEKEGGDTELYLGIRGGV